MWLSTQLGAREHYAIPRALHYSGSLECLITDAWVSETHLLGAIRVGLRERFHPDLAGARVRAWNAELIAFELTAKTKRLSGWPLIIARNNWFQGKVISFLSGSQRSAPGSQPVLFSYSYTALEPFRLAKSRGWKTVLGQIDPGPVEERIVAEEVAREPELGSGWKPAPTEYWENWRKECELADHIIVNSEWSRTALVEAGIANEKLSIIPLAYDHAVKSEVTEKNYPERFSRQRPLRVLFLGQVNLRKGISRLLKATNRMRDDAVEFWIVGPAQIRVPTEFQSCSRIRWFGPVPRNSASKFYEQADVFILPTLSDGFAITQLEALAHRVPVIASRHCGEVVRHGVNGLLLPDATAEAIELALRFCLENPQELAAFSAAAAVDQRHTVRNLTDALASLDGELGTISG